MFAAAAAFVLWIVMLGPAPLGDGRGFSTTVVDRDGRLLRPYATAEGRWRLPARADSVDPRFLAMLISRPMAAISKASAPPRSHGSARSRGG
jgi:penicillin-binding protein 1C